MRVTEPDELNDSGECAFCVDLQREAAEARRLAAIAAVRIDERLLDWLVRGFELGVTPTRLELPSSQFEELENAMKKRASTVWGKSHIRLVGPAGPVKVYEAAK